MQEDSEFNFQQALQDIQACNRRKPPEWEKHKDDKIVEWQF
jgi:hypothetical protein